MPEELEGHWSEEDGDVAVTPARFGQLAQDWHTQLARTENEDVLIGGRHWETRWYKILDGDVHGDVQLLREI
jgi:hypothetical protein